MSNPEQRLCRFLRLTALVLFPAAGAVVMPYAWMNAISELLGLGTLPDTPLVAYLTRSLSAVCAVLGLYCWIVAGDVKRYLPLLAWSVPIGFAFSAVVIVIEFLAEMPVWWTLRDAAFLLGWTSVLWWLLKRAQGG